MIQKTFQKSQKQKQKKIKSNAGRKNFDKKKLKN